MKKLTLFVLFIPTLCFAVGIESSNPITTNMIPEEVIMGGLESISTQGSESSNPITTNKMPEVVLREGIEFISTLTFVLLILLLAILALNLYTLYEIKKKNRR